MFKPPRWIAHRGGGCLAPENTLAGIRRAAQLGFAGVEFDVMLSKDGTPVLIHDETLERTTNGQGRVAETADAELFRLNAGSGERIPPLAEAAALCRELGLWANVEIKPAAGVEQETGRVVGQAVSALWQGATDRLLMSSFSFEALMSAMQFAPHLPRGLLFDRLPPDWQAAVEQLGAVSIHLNALHLDDAVMREISQRSLPVLVYTVNDPGLAHTLLARGVAGMFTDRLDLFAPKDGEAR